jgi:hypothetical protein
MNRTRTSINVPEPKSAMAIISNLFNGYSMPK